MIGNSSVGKVPVLNRNSSVGKVYVLNGILL